MKKAPTSSKILQNNLNNNFRKIGKSEATCPSVTLNGKQIPQSDNIKYLRMYLDKWSIWKKPIFLKRKQLGLKLSRPKSEISTENKMLLYKCILKPTWSYGIKLLVNRSFSQKVSEWWPNLHGLLPIRLKTIHQDQRVLFVKSEIAKNIEHAFR